MSDTLYQGCRLAAPNASYWHAVAHDYANSTLCGIALADSLLREDYTPRDPCPRCSAALATR